MRRTFTLAICLIALALAGCGKNKANSSTANIRFLHVSPDSGQLHVVLNTDTSNFASNLAYETATSYQSIGSGAQEVKVISATGASQIDNSYSFSSGSSYSLVIFGSASATGALLITDGTTAPASGNFRFRLADVATGTTPVDIYALSTGTDLLSSTPKISGIGAGGTSGYVEIAQGDYRLVITAQNSKEPIYDSGVRTYSNSTSFTVVAYSAESAKLVNAISLIDDSAGSSSLSANPYARIKTVHAAPDLNFIDLLLNGNVTFSDIPYKGVSSYVTVASGSKNVQVQATNVPGSFIASANSTFTGGRDYSVITTDVQGVGKLIVLPDVNLPPTAGNVSVRFVNATVDTASIDVLVNFAKQVSGLALNTSSSYLVISPSNTYALTFNTAGTTTAVLTLPSVELDANGIYTIYVVGGSAHLEGILTRDN